MYLFIYLFRLCWVFVAVHGLPLAVASRGHSSLQCTGYSSLRCTGFPLLWPLLLQSTGPRHASFSSRGRRASAVVARGLQSAGSAAAAHGPSRSATLGILPDQGSNPRPLHRQADSQPLRHQGSPEIFILMT